MMPPPVFWVLLACANGDPTDATSTKATPTLPTDSAAPCPAPVPVCACPVTVDLSAVAAVLVDGPRVGTVAAGRIDLSAGAWEGVVCDGLQQAELLDYDESAAPTDGSAYPLDLSDADGQGVVVVARDADGVTLGSVWAQVDSAATETSLVLVAE